MVVAKCGFEAKNEFGLQAHERRCAKCQGAVAVPEPAAPAQVAPVPEVIDDGLVDVTIEIPITINGHVYSGTHRVTPTMRQELQYRQSMYRKRLSREQRNMEFNRHLGEIKG